MQGVTSIAPGAVTASTGALYVSAAGSTRRADSLVLKSSLFGGKGVLLHDLAGSARKSVKVDDVEAGKGKAFQVRAATQPLGGKSLGVFDKVANLIKGIVHHPTAEQETVTYKGIARIAKKRFSVSNLLQADLLDFPATVQDKTAELAGQRIQIQLVSVNLDPGNKEAKLSHVRPVEGWLTNTGDLDLVADEDDYSISFKVPADFGEIGAFVIKNFHPNEFFLKDLRLQGPGSSTISFKTLAWIHPHKKYPKDRVFFTSKTYLPSATPAGLVALRQQELEQTRGDGKGKREPWDRIYDYDVYNDLGEPGKDVDQRHVLGGSKDFPYPRRMRTGRPMSTKDPRFESRLPPSAADAVPYIPSDEFFLRTKNSTFVASTLKGIAHSILPRLKRKEDPTRSFKDLKEINDLYKNGLPIKIPESTLTSDLTAEYDDTEGSRVYFSTMFAPKGENNSIINYPMPEVYEHDKTAWVTDEEYGRQALAGLNPAVIKLVTVYPPTSTLDQDQYGEATSLTHEHILPHLEGQTVAQAIKSKKLFTIDYYDAVLPFIERANSQEAGFKSYAPRTIFFLNRKGQMKPVAIELSKPADKGKVSHRVFTPAEESVHLWTLAKLHAASIDSSYHQVLSHFTYTHATVEPFIIASNRQLSKLHPIRSLLQPHFKDTLAINAGARESLINWNGTIEGNFTMGKYSMELGSVGYGAFWKFDTMGIPGELISRGMAEPADASYPGSVKLVVEDYPYAKDGLEVWDALYKWVETYCDIAYNSSDEAVKTDKEIQAWWNEVVNVGHGDHKDAPWWPKLDSIKTLAHIVTSVAWIAGPFHASVNFGQYSYSGYPLNKPSATRKFIPEKNILSSEYRQLQEHPEKFILDSISNSAQATTVMTVLELLATHSVDEEYIGLTSMSTDWTAHPKIAAAFRELSNRIATIGDNIKERNNDKALGHRSGPAQVPYTLLYPTSTSGLTGRGVPYSISI